MPGTNARSRPVYRRSEGPGSAQPGLFVASDERLEAEHLVRRLRPLVEDLFGQELRARSNRVGGFSYDPVSLLSVWVYGFMEGVLTSRPLERLVRYDARYEFLAGSCRIDHSTLSRFRNALGESLDEIMARLLLAARELGILERRTMAVDGTKIAAVKSQWARVRKEADAREDLESEAATLVSHGRYLVGYNVQAAADADSGLLVGYAATSEANDADQLERVCEAVARQSGALSERAVCDRGYDSSQNAVALDSRGVEGFLPSRTRGREALLAVGEDGRMRCRAGHAATRSEWTDPRTGRVYDHYRVSRCSGCALKAECPGKGERQRATKLARVDPDDLKHRANARCRTDEGRALSRLRGKTVERPFAVLKQRFGLRRFHLRGLKGANVEFGLAALTFNLCLLMSYLG
jgi:transposase